MKSLSLTAIPILLFTNLIAFAFGEQIVFNTSHPGPDFQTKSFGVDYLAKIVTADTDNCNFRTNKEDFYRTIIFGSIGRYVGESSKACYYSYIANGMWVGDARKTGFSRDEIGCQKYDCPDNANWFGLKLSKAMNTMNDDELNMIFHFTNGAGQVYIPILHATDANLNNGNNMYLHIVPDDYVLNDGNALKQYGGVVLWNAFNKNGSAKDLMVRQFRININSILKSLSQDFTANFRPYITKIQQWNNCADLHASSVNTVVYKHRLNAQPGVGLCDILKQKEGLSFSEFIKYAKIIWSVCSAFKGF